MNTPTLLSVLRDRAAVRRFSPRTTNAYARWVRVFVRYHRMQHPRTLGAEAVREFLVHLARDRQVAASTQNQAHAALRFLYRDVLEEPLAAIDGLVPAKRPHTLPNVLSRADVQRVLAHMQGVPKLMAQLLYRSGLRLQECCQLRMKDLDVERGELRVRRGKGNRDRVSMLPASVRDAIEQQMTAVRRVRMLRVARGGGHVAVADAARRSGIPQRVGCHTLRHSLPRICSNPDTTSAPCRSSSVTRTSRPRCSTRTCSTEGVSVCGALSTPVTARDDDRRSLHSVPLYRIIRDRTSAKRHAASRPSIGARGTCGLITGATPFAIDCRKLQGMPTAAVIPPSPILVRRTT
jgi:site-specific recombinase XerD